MKISGIAAACAALAACDPTPALPPPLVIRTAAYPDFVVECRNTTARPVSPTAPITALRLDGVVIASKGSIGSYLGGMPPHVAPGGTFKHRVILHPDTITRTSSQGLEGTGARLQTDWAIPLSKGRHSVAFQCLDNWTDAVTFEW